jgi:hypothetical protein
VYELEGVLGPSVMRFVERYVRSLLTWDILVFFHRNPDVALDADGIASRLGRRTEELAPELDELCRDELLLRCEDGLIRYGSDMALRETVGEFVDSCQDRGQRLALIALVLRKISP